MCSSESNKYMQKIGRMGSVVYAGNNEQSEQRLFI